LIFSDPSDVYAAIHGKFGFRTGIKITDMGASLFRGTAEAMKIREGNVLIETSSRILDSQRHQQLLDLNSIDNPRTILAALDAYANHLFNMKEMLSPRDEYALKNALFGLSTAVLARICHTGHGHSTGVAV
jgi:acetamidase/formamidase